MRKCCLSLLILGMIAFSVGPTRVFGQDQDDCGCNDILAAGVFRTKISATEETRANALKAYVCTTESAEIMDSRHVASGIAGDLFGIIGLSLSADGKTDTVEVWKRGSCTNIDRSAHEDTVRQIIEKVADQSILREFNNCVRSCSKAGLHCSIRWMDRSTVMFSARFVHTLPDQPDPIVTGGQFTGGSQITRDLSGEPPLRNGVPIPSVGRLTSIFRVEDEATMVIVNLSTDKAGSCTAESPYLTTEYLIRMTVRGEGVKKEPVSATRYESIHNPNRCTESNTVITFDVCLPETAIAISTELTEASGTAWHAESVYLHRDKDNCGVLKLHYRDNGRTWYGECKGHGRSRGRITVRGHELNSVQLEPKEFVEEVEVEAGSVGSVSFSYPLADFGDFVSLKWYFTANVTRQTLRNRDTFALTKDNPKVSGISAIAAENGVVTIDFRELE